MLNRVASFTGLRGVFVKLTEQVRNLMEHASALQSSYKEERSHRQRLEWELRALKAKLYNPKSEKCDPNQLQLMLDGFEDPLVVETKPKQTLPAEKELKKKKKQSKRMFFPASLPVETIELDVPEEERLCPTTGQERPIIRWEESEKIDFVPSHFRKLLIRRAVRALPYALQQASEALIEEPVVTAPMPAEYRIIPGAVCSVNLLSWLLVARYCDHLPFYRIQSQFRRQHQVILDRGVLCHWVKRSAQVLEPLYEAMRKELISGQYLQIDETFINLLDPDYPGKAKKSYFWVITRPREGVLFHFDPGRAHTVALTLLEGFSGRLQSDGYSAYETLVRKNPKLVLFGCWAHVRRKFRAAMDIHESSAAWYVAEIAKLYEIESEARVANASFEDRALLRQNRSQPVLATIRKRLDADHLGSHYLPSSPLAKAINYALNQWDGLIRYAQPGNGIVEIDNNRVENAIRPSAIGKKNWLFIGHPNAGQRSAIIYTIVENCRLHDIDPMKYITDVLPRLVDCPEGADLSDLLPKRWKNSISAT